MTKLNDLKKDLSALKSKKFWYWVLMIIIGWMIKPLKQYIDKVLGDIENDIKQKTADINLIKLNTKSKKVK